jgi:DNA polymerase-1
MLKIEKLNNNDMILQIHDELIFESNNLENIQKYKQIMEGIFELDVPLKVDINKGKRWGELK